MNTGDDTVLQITFVIVAIGGIYSFIKMVGEFINGAVKMNIFGGGVGQGSKRITCDKSESEVEALKQRDIYAGKVKEDGGFLSPQGLESKQYVEGALLNNLDNSFTISKFESPNTSVRHPLDIGDGKHLNAVQYPIESKKLALIVDTVEDESDIREVLYGLFDFLNETNSEDSQWQWINGVYCRLTYGKPREKAEVIKRYFQMLAPNFKKKDGTVYSKVVNAEEAKHIINELIEVYPWDIPIVKKADRKAEVKNNEVAELKGAVVELCSVIEDIKARLDKIK